MKQIHNFRKIFDPRFVRSLTERSDAICLSGTPLPKSSPRYPGEILDRVYEESDIADIDTTLKLRKPLSISELAKVLNDLEETTTHPKKTQASSRSG
jgi:hypothetical protein